jgi:nucleotide-binding universal stress UspA family protein
MDTPPAKIVLAVDASTEPERAARTIARVAERGAEVIVVHVHEVDRVEGDLVDERIQSVTAELQAAGFAVVVVTSHALPHTVAGALAEVAREVGAGLIVVGGGGRLLAALRHGGVSADLRRRASCPVLVEP